MLFLGFAKNLVRIQHKSVACMSDGHTSQLINFIYLYGGWIHIVLYKAPPSGDCRQTAFHHLTLLLCETLHLELLIRKPELWSL